MIDQTKYRPGQLQKAVATRKEQFEKLNKYVRLKGGWLVSIPGDELVTMQCLEHSQLPEQLRGLGYDDVEEIGRSEKILHTAIVEKLARGPDGTLVPWREDLPLAETRHHAGICPVTVWRFAL